MPYALEVPETLLYLCIISARFDVILSFFPFLSGALHSATLPVLFAVGSQHVIELGSGLGLVGISALFLFPLASFTFTDCHPQVLGALRENLQLQQSVCVCTCNLKYSQLSCIVSVLATCIWCRMYKPLHHTSSVHYIAMLFTVFVWRSVSNNLVLCMFIVTCH